MTQILKPTSALVGGILLGSALILAVPANAQPSGRMQQMLARADADGDGEITRAEFDRVRDEMFSRLDRNGDGHVDRSDRPRRFGDRFDQAYQTFAPLDANGDQRISRAELVEGDAPAFVAGDTNGDQVLSRDEIAALRSRR